MRKMRIRYSFGVLSVHEHFKSIDKTIELFHVQS